MLAGGLRVTPQQDVEEPAENIKVWESLEGGLLRQPSRALKDEVYNSTAECLRWEGEAELSGAFREGARLH